MGITMTNYEQRRADWEQRYHEGKTGWDRGEASPALAQWMQTKQIPQAEVLVPGCGNGHEIADLVRYGCHVTAVDIALPPIERLNTQLTALNLTANVVHADLLHWQPQQTFDAVYEQTCLCALNPTEWQEYEQRLFNWIKPGGKLFALFMQTGKEGGPPFDCPIIDMRSLFDSQRWRWSDNPDLDVPHPNGYIEHGFVLERIES